MDITIKQFNSIKLVSLKGDITTNTVPSIQTEILPLITPSCKILVDMSEVLYMSSAGLRMLLLLYRQTAAQDGQLVLVGLSEEITDTMAVTGFLEYFTTCTTVETGLNRL